MYVKVKTLASSWDMDSTMMTYSFPPDNETDDYVIGVGISFDSSKIAALYVQQWHTAPQP